jgi:hypothetical protein
MCVAPQESYQLDGVGRGARVKGQRLALMEDGVLTTRSPLLFAVHSESGGAECRLVDAAACLCDCPNSAPVCSHLYAVCAAFPELGPKTALALLVGRPWAVRREPVSRLCVCIVCTLLALLVGLWRWGWVTASTSPVPPTYRRRPSRAPPQARDLLHGARQPGRVAAAQRRLAACLGMWAARAGPPQALPMSCQVGGRAGGWRWRDLALLPARLSACGALRCAGGRGGAGGAAPAGGGREGAEWGRARRAGLRCEGPSPRPPPTPSALSVLC